VVVVLCVLVFESDIVSSLLVLELDLVVEVTFACIFSAIRGK